jgi:hypothetical protein
MGDLKPIGSEKLKGEDKLKRILELTYFNENKNTPSNPRAEIIKESTIGGIYGIVKEKDSYYVKRGLNESSLDYIGGMFMKNKNRFSSYSEALKRLELLKGQEELQEATKYVLKQNKPADMPPPAAEAPIAPPSEVAPEAPLELPPAEGDAPMPDAGMEGLPPSDEELPAAPQGEDDSDPLKMIQKLTGKLGQRLRDAQEDMESDDIKYVINSVVSALNLDKLDSEDKEEILTQFEDEDSFEGEESPEMGDEMPVAPETEDSELGEENDLAMDALENLINTSFTDEDEDEVDEPFVVSKPQDTDDYKMKINPGGEEDEYFRSTSRDFYSDFDLDDEDDEDYFSFDIKEEDPIGNEEGMTDETVELDINELTDVINQSVKEALGKYLK